MNLSGIKNAEYLASYIGKKIAIKVDKDKYDIYPMLMSIHANRMVVVQTKSGRMFAFSWDVCESPYILLQSDVEITIR